MCSHSNLHTLYILNLGLWCLSAWLNKMLVSGVFAVYVCEWLFRVNFNSSMRMSLSVLFGGVARI